MFENYLKDMDRLKGIPFLINKFGYKRMIEVGVREGFFSEHILKNTNLDIYVGIDIDVSSPNLQRIYGQYKNYLVRCGYSLELSKMWNYNSADVVYIDAAHDMDSVFKDVEAWWPIVKSGGLFAGDDFLSIPDGEHPEGSFGVCSAIESWTKMRGLDYYVTGTAETSYTGKLAHASRMWRLITSGEHKNCPDFQIPQWWIIKE